MAKILIVDDEPRIRDLIREHLQYAGFTWKTETWNSRRQNRPKRSWRKTTLEMQ